MRSISSALDIDTNKIGSEWKKTHFFSSFSLRSVPFIHSVFFFVPEWTACLICNNQRTEDRLTLTLTLANINLNTYVILHPRVQMVFGIFLFAPSLVYNYGVELKPFLLPHNAPLDMDQLNFLEKRNLKFKASNTITRYYFVYRVNKFYDSTIFVGFAPFQPSWNIQCFRQLRYFSSLLFGSEHIFDWISFVCINLSLFRFVAGVNTINFLFLLLMCHIYLGGFFKREKPNFITLMPPHWFDETQINKEALFYRSFIFHKIRF